MTHAAGSVFAHFSYRHGTPPPLPPSPLSPLKRLALTPLPFPRARMTLPPTASRHVVRLIHLGCADDGSPETPVA